MTVNGYFGFTKSKQEQINPKTVRVLGQSCSWRTVPTKAFTPPGALRASTGRQMQNFPDKHKSGIKGSICKVFYLKFCKVKTSDHLSICHSHYKEEWRFKLVQSELRVHLQHSVGTLEVKRGFKVQTLGALAQPFNIKNSRMYKNAKVWQWQHMKSCDWKSPRVHAVVHTHPPTQTLAWKHKLTPTSATKKCHHVCAPRHQSQTSIYSKHQ